MDRDNAAVLAQARPSPYGGTSAAPPPPRETVFSVLNEQEHLLSSVHETLNQLEQNLAPILANHPAVGGAGTGDKIRGADPSPGGVLRRVGMHNRGLEFLIGRLRDIGERLEL